MENKTTGLTREVLESVIEKTGYAQLVGAKLTNYEAGMAELIVPLRAELTQHHGFAHGALVAFLADSACAWTAASVVGDVVTSEYKLNLVAPAIGDHLIGRGSVVHTSRRQVITQANVYASKDGAEKLVATALATIARIGPK